MFECNPIFQYKFQLGLNSLNFASLNLEDEDTGDSDPETEDEFDIENIHEQYVSFLRHALRQNKKIRRQRNQRKFKGFSYKKNRRNNNYQGRPQQNGQQNNQYQRHPMRSQNEHRSKNFRAVDNEPEVKELRDNASHYQGNWNFVLFIMILIHKNECIKFIKINKQVVKKYLLCIYGIFWLSLWDTVY